MAGFRLGSVFGIEIRIDVSWFVIFFLVLWTLTRGVFPAAVPGLSPAAYAVMGIAGTLLLFASLLAHEMAHSLVARRLGLAVSGITLFILGGIMRNGTPVGLITLPLVGAIPRADWSDRTVADAMMSAGPGNMVGPEDELPVALEKLAGSAVGRVLVTHGGRLLGILSHTDISHCVEKERLRAQLNG